jgi:general secretion pathway protein F
MEPATLDDLMAMNEQLAALAAAGVPVDVGLGSREIPDTLERLNFAVARGLSRGASLPEALEANRPVAPAAYIRTVQLAVRDGDFPAALAGATQVAELVDESRSTFRLAMWYPLIVCCVAYVGLVGLCLILVPVLEGMAEEFRTQPGPALRVLQSLRDTLPIWVAIPPILLAAWLAWRQVRGRRAHASGRVPFWLAWLPGMSRAIREERCANLAARLSTLLAEGVPMNEALPLAAEAFGDATLIAASQELTAGLTANQLPPDSGRAALSFPPFLRWALWHAEESVGRARALAIAAELYQAAAQRRMARLRVVLPLATCVLVGGGATLLYGLALFVPVVEMLRSVS